MNTRIAGALFLALFTTAAAHAQTVIVLPTPSADALEPATMPDYCTERDVNCVLDDGLPPRRAMVGAIGTAGASVSAPDADTTTSSGALTGSAGATRTNRSRGFAGAR